MLTMSAARSKYPEAEVRTQIFNLVVKSVADGLWQVLGIDLVNIQPAQYDTEDWFQWQSVMEILTDGQNTAQSSLPDPSRL